MSEVVLELMSLHGIRDERERATIIKLLEKRGLM